MDKISIIYEAWDDFFNWFRVQPKWAELSLREKQYIYRANTDRHKGARMDIRIETILKKHAPKRYEFRGVVIIHE